jgi:hypothetical protein
MLDGGHLKAQPKESLLVCGFKKAKRGYSHKYIYLLSFTCSVLNIFETI